MVVTSAEKMAILLANVGSGSTAAAAEAVADPAPFVGSVVVVDVEDLIEIVRK